MYRRRLFRSSLKVKRLKWGTHFITSWINQKGVCFSTKRVIKCVCTTCHMKGQRISFMPPPYGCLVDISCIFDDRLLCYNSRVSSYLHRLLPGPRKKDLLTNQKNHCSQRVWKEECSSVGRLYGVASIEFYYYTKQFIVVLHPTE